MGELKGTPVLKFSLIFQKLIGLYGQYNLSLIFFLHSLLRIFFHRKIIDENLNGLSNFQPKIQIYFQLKWSYFNIP